MKESSFASIIIPKKQRGVEGEVSLNHVVELYNRMKEEFKKQTCQLAAFDQHCTKLSDENMITLDKVLR